MLGWIPPRSAAVGTKVFLCLTGALLEPSVLPHYYCPYNVRCVWDRLVDGLAREESGHRGLTRMPVVPIKHDILASENGVFESVVCQKIGPAITGYPSQWVVV